MLDGPHQRLGECADDAGGTDIDRLLWKFASGNSLAQQALEHIAEVATAQAPRGLDVRTGRFGDERICQIRPLQSAPCARLDDVGPPLPRRAIAATETDEAGAPVRAGDTSP